MWFLLWFFIEILYFTLANKWNHLIPFYLNTICIYYKCMHACYADHVYDLIKMVYFLVFCFILIILLCSSEFGVMWCDEDHCHRICVTHIQLIRISNAICCVPYIAQQPYERCICLWLHDLDSSISMILAPVVLLLRQTGIHFSDTILSMSVIAAYRWSWYPLCWQTRHTFQINIGHGLT